METALTSTAGQDQPSAGPVGAVISLSSHLCSRWFSTYQSQQVSKAVLSPFWQALRARMVLWPYVAVLRYWAGHRCGKCAAIACRLFASSPAVMQRKIRGF